MNLQTKILRSFTSILSAKNFANTLSKALPSCNIFANFYKDDKVSRYTTAAERQKVSVPPDTEIINPLTHPDFFGVKKLVTLEDLFNARVHYGHKKGSRNEHMKPYLYGCRLDVDVIDLNHTLPHLHNALNFLAHVAFRKGIILFIIKSQQFGHHVEQLAFDCGEYAHTRTWLSGSFTNTASIGWEDVRLPDVCVFLSVQGAPYTSHTAVDESAKVGIMSVGVCDTNVNPTLISYPIPGNDDSLSSIELYCKLFKQAVLLGKAKRKEIDEDPTKKVFIR